LRGIAVLLVVLDHIFRSSLVFEPYTGWRLQLRNGLNWLSNGRASLAFFIVLSGYLLMRPVVASADKKLPGGVGRYIRRRARRLLPGYYAAFGSSLLLIALLPALRTSLSIEWMDALPAFGLKSLIAHLLLIHNFSFQWAFKDDPPIWTVATQWQIYLLFPLVLLPIWRRIGSIGVVSVAMTIGLGGFLYTGKGHAAAPWFIGLFTLGMAAAARAGKSPAGKYDAKIFGWLAALLFGAYAWTTLDFSFGGLRFLTVDGWESISIHWFFDTWIALATACLLIFASAVDRAKDISPRTDALRTDAPQTDAPQRGAAKSSKANSHWLLNWLCARWLVAIGGISYSLYLIHDSLLAVMKIAMTRCSLGPYEQFFVYLLIGLPMLLLISALFSRLFEKPFIGDQS
jgi:peptidoglycan/LPS O-acetylase OafA/YrhL